MKKNKLFTNKSGSNDLINQILHMLLAVVGVILILYISGNLYKTAFAADQGTSKNFQLMVEKINGLKPGEKTQYAFYLKKGFVIAGFGKSHLIKYDCLTSGKPLAAPPVQGCSGSCLCVCGEKNCDKPVECRALADVDSIFFDETKINYKFNAGEKAEGNYKNYNYVCIRIDCGINKLGFTDASDLFEIEKIKEDEKINVYLRKI